MRLTQIGLGGGIVICNQESRFIVAENLRDINSENTKIVLEPAGRNTAPAIAAAAIIAMQADKDAILLVLPADHVIKDIEPFRQAVNIAEKRAEEGFLVTFGIVPSGPNTEYGYIESGSDIDGQSARIASFKEKPSKDVAEKFLSQGNYFWNKLPKTPPRKKPQGDTSQESLF